MSNIIQYNFILGDRPKGASLLRANPDLLHANIANIGRYPQTWEHLVYGCDYYQALLNMGMHGGYFVTYNYADSVAFALSHPISSDNTLQVFFICTEEPLLLDQITADFHAVKNDDYVFVVNDKQKFWFPYKHVFCNHQETMAYMKSIASNYIEIDSDRGPYLVPDMIHDIDDGLLFMPSRVNTMVAHSMLGDFEYSWHNYTDEEISGESQSNIANSRTFIRQDMLIEQIAKMNAIEKQGLTDPLMCYPFRDTIKSPLIITLPYISTDLRQVFKAKAAKNLEDKDIQYVLSQPTTSNYTMLVEKEENMSADDIYRRGQIYAMIYSLRSQALDNLSLLHASFRFSPYLRLPFQGIEINKELSYVGPKLSSKLASSRNVDSIEKVMLTLGKKIAEKSISSKTIEMLCKSHRQIVAISDLPIEWITVNGVPLGFTHDVCRIPETPYEGILANYVVSRYQPFIIPKDILKHTLVVYGCRDDSFRYYQDQCDKLAVQLGFDTVECLSIQSFIDAMNKYKPIFLIIDTHGDTDLTLHQSYLLMGKEKLYPMNIAAAKVSAPLVFLSACNTAPTYNMVNTLANAFKEVGALAVTSSYMPLDVQESSTLYVRILNQLAIASQKNIHKNWLAFMSHILRTSYIHSAFYPYYEKNRIETVEDVKNGVCSKYLTDSMYYSKRRELYTKLKEGIEEDGIKISTTHRIPHYLMYSTIGRADLINFESFQEDLKNKIREFNEQ